MSEDKLHLREPLANNQEREKALEITGALDRAEKFLIQNGEMDISWLTNKLNNPSYLLMAMRLQHGYKIAQESFPEGMSQDERKTKNRLAFREKALDLAIHASNMVVMKTSILESTIPTIE